MSSVHGLLLGCIQGLGEFLPVSSSGHLLLVQILFGIQTDTPAMKMLDILLHFGTLIPVLIVFRREWADMILHPVRNKTLLLLFLASLPTLVIYLGAKKAFPSVNGFAVFDNGWFLGVSFLITAAFLLLCDRFASYRSEKGKKVGISHALVMGVFQGIGMIPGISRSGSTILGGVSTGLNKSTAARFSFMMSTPAILASMLMEGKDAVDNGYIKEIQPLPCILGMIAAAIVGYFSIRFMIRIITRFPLAWFSLYLAVLGVAFLAAQVMGLFNAPPFEIPVVSPVS